MQSIIVIAICSILILFVILLGFKAIARGLKAKNRK
tara:strand:- start:176 stop:283 length:108 start_codon:yes stop_codon:yes gene_type:complete